MQRIVHVLIILFLLSTIVQSQETGINPREITSAVVEIETSGKIHIPDGIDEITYLQTFPLEDESQRILSFNSSAEHTIKTDSQGNREIVFTWISPKSGILDYSIKMQIERKFPADVTSTESEAEEYLKNSGNLTKNDDKIRSKAAEVTSGVNNDLIKAAKLSKWVNENVLYDLNLSSVENNASWVFENKRGVCDELSHLFIAMARSQDIPARDVTGFVYNGIDWNAHAWAEVYCDGRWISFDPTYNEPGFVDGTHIVFSRDSDNARIMEGMQWSGRRVGELKNAWRADSEKIGGRVIGRVKEGVYNEKNETINFLEINKTKIIDARLDFYDPNVGENTVVNATLKLENLINTPIIGTFDVFTSNKIKVNYSPVDRIFYLEPYGKENLELNFEVPGMEDKNAVYLFPVVVKTFPYAIAGANLSVSTNIIAGVSIILGGEVLAGVDVINHNPYAGELIIGACMEDKAKKSGNCMEKTANIAGNSNKTLEFTFDVQEGNYTLFVKAESGGSFDEFRRDVEIKHSSSPWELVDVPYIKGFILDEFSIIVFLIAAITGVILLKKFK